MAPTYPDPVRTGAWGDVAIGAGFVVAATVEAAVTDHPSAGLLAFEIVGALCLSALVVRRRRPLLTMTVLAAAGVLGSVGTQLLWPEAPDSGGVWIFALMLASYSLGAYGHGPGVLVGVLAPLVVVTSADLASMNGWPRVNGMVFVTVFVGCSCRRPPAGWCGSAANGCGPCATSTSGSCGRSRSGRTRRCWPNDCGPWSGCSRAWSPG